MLAEAAVHCGRPVTVCVATDTGEALLSRTSSFVTVHKGRLDAAAMEALMRSVPFDFVIDATHPYAALVSANARAAAAKTGVVYRRLLRAQSAYPDCIMADSVADACTKAGQGNILAATGSKEIAAYQCIENFAARVFARVLPSADAVAACHTAGIAERHILAAKGPFTVQQNCEVMQKYKIKTMITKDGGQSGGFAEKLAAAKICGVQVIVVRRPPEPDGYSYETILSMLKEG